MTSFGVEERTEDLSSVNRKKYNRLIHTGPNNSERRTVYDQGDEEYGKDRER